MATKNYINLIDDAIGKWKSGSILPDVLRGYEPIDGDFTSYQKYPGGYCVVYPLVCSGKSNKCIRLWHRSFDKQLVEQLAELLKELHDLGSDFVIGYEYYENGLRLDDGEIIPAVVMDWIEGSTLIDYIREHCNDYMAIRRLAQKFYTIISVMHREGMAHGDLSCDNIMVKQNGKIVLIDYDSFYSPKLSDDIKQTNKGTPGYQHPGRTKSLYLSSDMDNFSQQVIYLSLIAIAQDPSLANEDRRLIVDKKMLFDCKDFSDDNSFVSSEGYKALSVIDNTEVRNRLAELRRAVNGRFSDVRSIVEYSSHTGRQELEGKNKKIREELVKKRDTEFNQAKSDTSVRASILNMPHSSPTSATKTPPKIIPWYKKGYVWVCAAIVAAIVYVAMPLGKESPTKHDVQTELAITAAISRLEGNYTLREKNGGTLVNGIRTAAIKKIAELQAQILVTSEYGPEFYDFTISSNGIVESEQLGTGEITYNEKLDKITLTFKRGERICEFVK